MFEGLVKGIKQVFLGCLKKVSMVIMSSMSLQGCVDRISEVLLRVFEGS